MTRRSLSKKPPARSSAAVGRRNKMESFSKSGCAAFWTVSPYLHIREVQQLLGVPAQDAVLFLLAEGQGADGGHGVRLALPRGCRCRTGCGGGRRCGPCGGTAPGASWGGPPGGRSRHPGGQIPQGVGGVQIDGGVGQQLLHLVPVPPAAHVGQDEGHGTHLGPGRCAPSGG